MSETPNSTAPCKQTRDQAPGPAHENASRVVFFSADLLSCGKGPCLSPPSCHEEAMFRGVFSWRHEDYTPVTRSKQNRLRSFCIWLWVKTNGTILG